MSKEEKSNKEIRSVIYARCSTEEQAAGQHSTIESQIDRCRQAIVHHPGRNGGKQELMHIYQDEASGKNIKGRPQFQQLIEDAKAGQFDMIYSIRLDRLSRSVIDFLTTVELLNGLNVGITLLDEDLDTTTPMGRFAMHMMVALAQLERENIASRVTNKMIWRAQQGLRNGSHLIGYHTTKENPGVLVPVPDEAELVSLIFKKYIELGSATLLVKFLNEHGYRTPWEKRKGSGKPGTLFQTTTVLNILRNPTYIGKIVYRGEVYEGKHDGIIDPRLFEQVQKMIGVNAPKRKNRRRSKGIYPYVFQGLLRCGLCGYAMTPTYSGDKGKKSGYHVYYECSGKAKKGREFCEMRRLPARAIDEALVKVLNRIMLDEDELDRILDESAGEQGQAVKDLLQKRDTLVRDIAAKRMNMNRLLAVIESGTVNDDAPLSDRYNLLTQEVKAGEKLLAELDAELKQAKSLIADRETVARTMASLGELLDRAKPEEIKPVLPYFVHSVEITEEKAKIGMFERPQPSTYSITEFLGNASCKDDDDPPPGYYLPSTPSGDDGGNGGVSPGSSCRNETYRKGENLTSNRGNISSPSGVSNRNTGGIDTPKLLSACGLEPISGCLEGVGPVNGGNGMSGGGGCAIALAARPSGAGDCAEKSSGPRGLNQPGGPECCGWLPRQDLNLKSQNQNLMCCQLHHGVVLG